MKTKATVQKNGPLLVHGVLEVTDALGHTETKDKVTAFC